MGMIGYNDFAPDGAGKMHAVGQANVVFCDGHVESPTLKLLFADTHDTALARWNRDHLPHHEKLTPKFSRWSLNANPVFPAPFSRGRMMTPAP